MRTKIYLILVFCSFLGCKKEEVVVVNQNQQLNLTAPELTFPQNKAQFINCNSVAFKWNAVLSAKKYQLLIATDSSFQNIVKDFSLNNEAGLPSFYLQYTYTEQNSSIIRSTLYWKVKAIDSAGNSSEYSKFHIVKCVTNLDVSPTITNTPNDLVIVDPYQSIPTITWAKDPNVVSYEIFGSYSDKFVDKTNDQNFNFNITSGSDIKLAEQTDNFYKFYIFNLRWDDTLQFVVRQKFADGTYSKWSLTNVIIKDPQIALFAGNYQVKMKFYGDTTTYNEIASISKYSNTSIALSIPAQNIMVKYDANYYFAQYYPNRIGEFSYLDSKARKPVYLTFKTENNLMNIKANTGDFQILSGYRF